jgi:uncharacterized cupin superfamily protein
MSWHLLAAMASAVASAIAVRYKPEALERPETPVFVAGPAGQLEMRAAPIEPSWVIEGNPQARIAHHSQGDDESALTAVWDCTAGTFRWFFGWDETVMILEGEVLVEAADGSRRLLRAGDIAYFKGGTWATWQIDTYLRKIAFIRRPAPAPLAALYRLRARLRRKPAIGLAA